MKPDTSKATARPWRFEESNRAYDIGSLLLYGSGPSAFIGRLDCHEVNTEESGQANAALIVAAVNEHDALCAVADAAAHVGASCDSSRWTTLALAFSQLAAVRKGEVKP